MRAEGEVVPFPSEHVEVVARFDEFFEEEHERLFKALYFVTGNRHDAEELMQDVFVALWERWGQIDEIHFSPGSSRSQASSLNILPVAGLREEMSPGARS
jgi:hypothetical protein